MKKKVMVVAAHADDEVLGCGATIAKHAAAGDEIVVAVMADGVSSRGVIDSEEIKKRQSQSEKAVKFLGAMKLIHESFPDNMLDSVPRLELIRKIEDIIYEFSPEIIYTHHLGDLNIDHQRVSEAVMVACRAQPSFSVKEILYWENASSTEWQNPGYLPFNPNCFIDVSGYLQKKLDALKFYEDEMRDWPHARSSKSLEHLARWRGAVVGVEAAEAFMIGRSIR